MMENKEQEIRRIRFEDLISILFIVTSLLNIYADNLYINYLNTNDQDKEKLARDIYLIVIIITIAVYYYFINRNYKFLKFAKENNQDQILPFIRLLGSIFFMVGILLLLYVLVESNNIQGEIEV